MNIEGMNDGLKVKDVIVGSLVGKKMIGKYDGRTVILIAGLSTGLCVEVDGTLVDDGISIEGKVEGHFIDETG